MLWKLLLYSSFPSPGSALHLTHELTFGFFFPFLFQPEPTKNRCLTCAPPGVAASRRQLRHTNLFVCQGAPCVPTSRRAGAALNHVDDGSGLPVASRAPHHLPSSKAANDDAGTYSYAGISRNGFHPPDWLLSEARQASARGHTGARMTPYVKASAQHVTWPTSRTSDLDLMPSRKLRRKLKEMLAVAISVVNGCAYCVTAHSRVLNRMFHPQRRRAGRADCGRGAHQRAQPFRNRDLVGES